MGFLSPDKPDIAVPEPQRTRPKEPPQKKQADTQKAGKKRRNRGRGRSDTVLSGELGGGDGEDQTSSLLGG